MNTEIQTTENVETAKSQLALQGYALIEGVLDNREVEALRDVMEEIFEHERQNPYDPGDGQALPDDDVMEKYIRESYSTTSKQELARVMRLIRHTREENHHTPWPVPPDQVMKLFWHRPQFEHDDKTQFVNHLPVKGRLFEKLAEHPTVLALARSVLGNDCVLSEMGGNKIGPQTSGGPWHVDVPLGQLPEPLPDFPLSTQNVFMLDDFVPENGATRLVPASHLRRKKPTWANKAMDDEVVMAAPAGSMAIWLSNTWHRVGPNTTNRPRRAILSYYTRCWIKPFADSRSMVTPEMAQRFSPTLRYLLGFSAHGICRGQPAGR